MKGLLSPKSGIQSGMSSIFAPHFGMYALSPLNKEYCRVTFFFNNQEVFKKLSSVSLFAALTFWSYFFT
jgi:hypothetical protein